MKDILFFFLFVTVKEEDLFLARLHCDMIHVAIPRHGIWIWQHGVYSILWSIQYPPHLIHAKYICLTLWSCAIKLIKILYCLNSHDMRRYNKHEATNREFSYCLHYLITKNICPQNNVLLSFQSSYYNMLCFMY